MKPDTALGLITVGMTVLGGVVSALPPADLVRKTAYIGSFIVLGTLAWVLVVKQAKQASKRDAELKNGIDRLAVQSAEVARLQTSNNELQKQVLDLTRMNTSLARESISTGTGGDSFCWMQINFQFGRPIPMFNHVGKYTLYQVIVRIVDLNDFQRKLDRGHRFNLSDDVTLPAVPEVPVSTSWFREALVLPFSDGARQDFNVFFQARNGRWTEFLRLRRINDHWSSAIQVCRQYNADGSQVPREPIFEQVDRDYPRNDKGLVDWNQ
ncbi:MAG: hypothetical protein ACRD2G_06125 [Terriglobia bacterium]